MTGFASRSRTYSKTKVSSEDSKTFEIVGDKYEEDAKAEFLKGHYRESFLTHRNAAKLYKKALDKLRSDRGGEENIREIETKYAVARAEGRRAALYAVTDEKTPPIFRGLIRRIKGRHILGSFFISTLFLVPNLTGGIIGVNNNRFFSLMGFIFFFLGVFLFWFFTEINIKVRSLINK